MTHSNSTDFTPSEGRRFAFPVGVAFLLLAGLFLWRDRMTLLWIASGLGSALILSGVFIPGRLGPIYRAWMQMALAISKVTTPIFMAIVYFVVLTPTGLVMRLFGHRSIAHEPRGGSLWQPAIDRESNDMRRQF